jgi:hypothetical protein
MTEINYNLLLEQAFKDFGQLCRERQETEWKLAQKEQFIRATINMLSDEEKRAWEASLDELSSEPVTLSDAIRKALQSTPNKFHTATQVRDALAKAKFDFSQYTTNPLSSIHSALKRLKPEEVQTEKIDGVLAWKWRESANLVLRRKRRRPSVSSRTFKLDPKLWKELFAGQAANTPQRATLSAAFYGYGNYGYRYGEPAGPVIIDPNAPNKEK